MVLLVVGCGDPAGIVMASGDMQEPLGLESEAWAGLCLGPFLRLGFSIDVWELGMRHSLCMWSWGKKEAAEQQRKPGCAQFKGPKDPQLSGKARTGPAVTNSPQGSPSDAPKKLVPCTAPPLGLQSTLLLQAFIS